MYLYQEISVKLRDQILEGLYKPTERLPSSRRIAGQFGTTQMTVHKALSELEKAGFVTVVPNSGAYVREAHAWVTSQTTTERKPSHLAGIIAFDTTTSLYWTRTAEAMEDALRSHGYHSVIGHSDFDVEVALKYVEDLVQKGIDGFIFVPIDMEREEDFERENARVVDAVAQTGLPLVLFDRHLTTRACSSVTIDNTGNARDLTESLLELGSSDPILVGMAQCSTLYEREEAFRSVLRAHGYRDAEDRVYRINTTRITSAHYDELEEILGRHPNLDGIFCINSSVFNGITDVLQKRSTRESVRLVGFNDMEIPHRDMADVLVEQPVYDFGYAAGELLALKLTNAGQPFGEAVHNVFMPTRTIRRDSL